MCAREVVTFHTLLRNVNSRLCGFLEIKCRMTTPHLNMGHGFVHHIIRNQVDRDNYDKKVKEQERQPLPSTTKQKKPERQHYVPPSHREERSPQQATSNEREDQVKGIQNSARTNIGATTDVRSYKARQDSPKKEHLFKFVYEDKHGECHQLHVYKEDNAGDLARQFGRNLSLSSLMTRALQHFLEAHIRDKRETLESNGAS